MRRWSMRFVVVAMIMAPLIACAPQPGGTMDSEVAADPPVSDLKIIRIGVPVEPSDLDPQNFSESVSQSIITHVHNNLFELSRDLQPEPVLAESAEVSEDGLSWTIRLRQGIQFHDGTTFTADAVKAIVDKTIGEDPPIRASFIGRNELESATIIDDYTVEIKTSLPVGPFLYMLAGPAWAINSPTAYETFGEQATKNPSGTGPYRFKEWVSGEYITLERNPDFFGDAPYYDQIVYQIVPEPATRQALLETGELDLVTNVTPADIPILEQNPNITVENVALNRILYIAINTQLPYLSDKRVRQAMNYAVDKQAIIDGIVMGLGEEAVSPIPRLTSGHTPVGQYEYDPDRAKALLAEAGVPADFSMDIWLPQGRYFQGEAIGQAVANYLREVGLNINDEVIEYGVFNADIRKPLEETEVNAYMLGWASSTLDADLALTGVLHSSQWAPAGANRGFYKNERVDELVDLARVTTDSNERAAIYAEAQELIWDDAPWIFLHYMQIPIAYTTGITGIHVWPTEHIDLRQAGE